MTQPRETRTSLTRRGFLGAGVGAALVGHTASGATPPGSDASGRPLPFNARTFGAMPTRNLGRTGHRVGIFSLGGQAVVESEDTDTAVAIVERAIDLGVNYIDTSPVYGRNRSETHIGMVLKRRRKEVYLATKTHLRTYDASMRLLESSLQRLQTDHLDCWQLHNVQRQNELDQIFAPDGAIKALEKARDQGIVRFLGITGHYDPRILVEGLRRYDFDSLLMAFNAADRHQESFLDTLLPVALEKRVAIIGMKVATRGRMLATWTPPPLDQQPKRMATTRPGTLTMREALFYNFSMPVATNIVGCDSPEQVEQNVQTAADFTPYNARALAALEGRCRDIVNQGLYFRKGIIDRDRA